MLGAASVIYTDVYRARARARRGDSTTAASRAVRGIRSRTLSSQRQHSPGPGEKGRGCTPGTCSSRPDYPVLMTMTDIVFGSRDSRCLFNPHHRRSRLPLPLSSVNTTGLFVLTLPVAERFPSGFLPFALCARLNAKFEQLRDGQTGGVVSVCLSAVRNLRSIVKTVPSNSLFRVRSDSRNRPETINAARCILFVTVSH